MRVLRDAVRPRTHPHPLPLSHPAEYGRRARGVYLPNIASLTIVTPSLLLMLTTSILLAAPAKEEDPSARAQETLRRVAKLPAEQQRQWLALVEQRYAWSAMLTMTDDEAKKEQVRFAQIARQKTVAWNDMVELLRQLDQREKLAIARLVRLYRAQVLQTFHTRQGELLARQDAWYRIWTEWEKAGSPPEQQDQLMDWLAASIKVCGREKPGPLPPDPKFGEGIPLVPEQLALPSLPPPPNLFARGPLPVRVPDAAFCEHRPVYATERMDVHRIEITPMPAFAARVLQPVEIAARRFIVEAVPDARELSALATPRHGSFVRMPSDTAAPPAEAELAASNASGAIVAKPQATDPERQRAELPRSSEMHAPSTEQTPVTLPQFTAPPPTMRRSESESAPEIADIPQPPRENVMAMLPPSQVAPGSRINVRVERRPLSSMPPANPEDQHAHINVEELAARIEGINLSLRTLEGELNEKHDCTADQLASMLNRLDILMLRQKDLAMFRDLITPQEQAKVGQIDSSRGAVSKIGTRISELRTQVRQSEAMPEAERAATLKHLDEVSDRLATMTAEK